MQQNWFSPCNRLYPCWKEVYADWKGLCSQGLLLTIDSFIRYQNIYIFLFVVKILCKNSQVYSWKPVDEVLAVLFYTNTNSNDALKPLSSSQLSKSCSILVKKIPTNRPSLFSVDDFCLVVSMRVFLFSLPLINSHPKFNTNKLTLF